MSSYELGGAVLRRSQPFVRRIRRALLVRRIKLLAAAANATVDVTIALDATIGRGITVEFGEGTHTVLRAGDAATIGNDVVLQLRGGEIDLGRWTELRHQSIVTVSGGRFVLGDLSILGRGVSVHCAHEVVIGERTGIASYATVVDTTHRVTEPGRPLAYDTVPGSVFIGDDVFVGANATVARNSKVGDYCVVASSSLVLGEVPAKTIVSGIPAKFVADVELPWE